MTRLLFFIFCFPGAVFAQESYQRVLLPLTSSNVAGALGSVWQTQTLLQNDSAQFVTILTLSTCVSGGCSAFDQLHPMLANTRFFPSHLRGVFVYIDSRFADQIHFSHHVFDKSRSAISAGTEIPVVGENEMITSTIHLMGIPLTDESRTAIRLYAPPEIPNPTARVRVYAMENRPTIGGEELIADEMISLSAEQLPGNNMVLYFPAFAMIPSLRDFVSEVPQNRLVRAQIEPSPGTSLWAFASITNNETQQVRMITPQ